MKILHFIEGRCNPDTANGVDKTIYFLTKELGGLGHEVHLVSETVKELIEIPGVVLHRVKPFRSCFSCPSEVAGLIKEIEPDLVHFHSAYVPGNISIARRLRRLGVPYVVTPNGNCARVLLKRRPWLKLPYKYLLERPYLNRAAFVHSVGDSEEILHYGVKAPIVEALNGIDPSTLPSEYDTSYLKKIIPRFKERFTCVFVGRLDVEQKGLDLLISAVASLGDNARNFGFVLIGPEWKGSRKRIETMIDQQGVSDSFHLHGPAFGAEKYDLLMGAEGFIYPSRWEGLPFAVVEAMAAGQLCLVTPASDPAGLLAPNKAGVVFPATEKGIAEGISRAEKLTKEEKERILESSATIVKERMTWDIIARTIEDAYRQSITK
ncbi:glycosyltransferase family 4 protein [Akkermansiaceae bacterium]|nr:glycosyltransferase family 4 protein [Akkermansiaceae bacterium]